MGFSVSGATAVLLVGLVIGIGIAYPTVTGSIELINDAREDRIDRWAAMEQSDIEIRAATYDGAEGKLNGSVENTGTITLEVESTDVLVDGEYATDVNATVEAFDDTDIWQPGETLNFTITDVEEDPEHVKVVVETGIADRSEVSEVS